MNASLTVDSERLVLRPGWLRTTAMVLGSVLFLIVGASAASPRTELAWWVGVGLAVVPLAVAFRCRLILTAEGFRFRWIWKGRLVPWSSVIAFYPTTLGLSPGVGWVLRDGPALPRSPWQWLRLMWRVERWQMPAFGGSREQTLETLNRWLNRYSVAPTELAADPKIVRVDAEQLQLENPPLLARLRDLQHRLAAGEKVDPAEVQRLMKDLGVSPRD